MKSGRRGVLKAKLVNGGRGHKVAKDGQGSNDDGFVNLGKKIFYDLT
jgi:hypothetical protein